MPADLKSIHGVEIFSTGTWNTETYTTQDLDEMVRAFEENKGAFRPYLKLGHDEDQKLLQADGLPAAGWIGSIYRRGEKLLADFVDIPQKIYELIENRAYRKVSSEIYWNIDIKGALYPRMLAAVALLGADTPAVMNLADIMSMYGIKDFGQIKIYATPENTATVRLHDYIPNSDQGEEMPKAEAELKLEIELQAEKDKALKLDEQLKAQKSEMSAKDAELETLRAAAAESEKKALDAEVKRQEAEVEAFITSLAAEKLISPAMKPYIQALMGVGKTEYAIADKKLSRAELVKETLKLHKATDVNTDEQTIEGEEQTGNLLAKKEEKIQAYMEEHKCSYKAAYKAIEREMPSPAAVPIGSVSDEA